MKRHLSIKLVGERSIGNSGRPNVVYIPPYSYNMSTLTKIPPVNGHVEASSSQLMDELVDAEDFFEQVLGG